MVYQSQNVTLRLVGCGFDPWPGIETTTYQSKGDIRVIPKTYPDAALFWNSVFWVGIWGLGHPMNPGHSLSAAHHPPLKDGRSKGETDFAERESP